MRPFGDLLAPFRGGEVVGARDRIERALDGRVAIAGVQQAPRLRVFGGTGRLRQGAGGRRDAENEGSQKCPAPERRINGVDGAVRPPPRECPGSCRR